jgi:microcystin-dependent protein
VSRSTYSSLFSAIGTTYGVGDGSTTFNLPDLRGEFPRGWDDGRGVDTGRVIGSAQADGFRTHSHAITGYSAGINNTAGSHFYNTNQFNTTSSTSTTSTPAGDSETRPRNIALLACIRF